METKATFGQSGAKWEVQVSRRDWERAARRSTLVGAKYARSSARKETIDRGLSRKTSFKDDD